MTIAIAAPTGHIGSSLASLLQKTGEKLILLARHPEKLESLVGRGAEVRTGSLENADYVIEATRGADALFWLTPPNTAVPDFRQYQRSLAANAATAIKVNKIEFVVNLSSVGAHHPAGLGPVSGLYDVEKAIDRAAENVTHLRPGMFMENTLMSLEAIKTAGSIFMPIAGDVKAPFIATQDIAEVAAWRLRNKQWGGRHVLHLSGPRDLTFNDIAKIFSDVLGIAVTHVNVPVEAARQAMLSTGLSEDMTDQYLELYSGFGSGLAKEGIPAEPDIRTTTTFDEFVRQVIRPLIRS